MFLPANKGCSLDAYLGFTKATKSSGMDHKYLEISNGRCLYFRGYFKIKLRLALGAQPLRNWLKHQTDLPFIGELMQYEFTAYLFSWGGALFDLFIVFILLNNRFRIYGYTLVIIFHGLTAVMFPIGVFPYVMIVSTLIFFSPDFHKNVVVYIQDRFALKSKNITQTEIKAAATQNKRTISLLLGLYILIVLIVPLRYLAYPGDLFWTEQGYRFSWRVMLIEKVDTLNSLSIILTME